MFPADKRPDWIFKSLSYFISKANFAFLIQQQIVDICFAGDYI